MSRYVGVRRLPGGPIDIRTLRPPEDDAGIVEVQCSDCQQHARAPEGALVECIKCGRWYFARSDKWGKKMIPPELPSKESEE